MIVSMADPAIVPPGDRRDRVTALGVVFAFSIGLGVGTVTIPLLALASGYDPAAVGFLVATAAAMQLASRLALPWLLGRFEDRTLIAISAAMMLATFVLLAISTEVVVFVAAQLLQGAARGIFWTSSQTHAIRDQPRPVQRLVDLNVAGSAGTLVGPAIGGILASLGLTVALVAAAIGALIAVIGSPLLRSFPPFDRRRSVGTWRLLRRSGVDIACWSSVVGGLWWSMVGSFVPVILVAAGVGAIGVGWSITASEAAGTVALLTLRSLRRDWIQPTVRFGGFVATFALVAIALLPTSLLVAVPLLVIGGAAAGTITALGPAMAALVASADEQGDALSLTGVFRAAALFAAPAAVGILIGPLVVGSAMAAVSVVVGLPGAVLGRGSTAASGRRLGRRSG
jgi:predicted MFS family arabinose efflux permease